jgi:hypothetical protein
LQWDTASLELRDFWRAGDDITLELPDRVFGNLLYERKGSGKIDVHRQGLESA